MSASTPQAATDAEPTVSELQAELRDLRAQLYRSQQLATVGTMAAMVAHEFNNILTPMINYARMAADGDERMRDKAIHYAFECSDRASNICRALLDVTGEGPPAPQQALLGELVDVVIAAMARDPGKDGVRLIKKVPAGLTVTTRTAELKQVLLNLLLNAREAVAGSGHGQSISIRAERYDGQVRLEVADTGVGIAPENLDRIFEPFFTTKGEDGTGLGLAVCRQIVESLGGRLTVRSQESKGTCFTVFLPGDEE